MEDNYILIRKSNNGVVFGLKKEINDIFSQIFKECRDGKVFFDDGSFLEYKLSNKDENLLYLKVTSDLSEMKAADLLDRFYCTLTKGNHRKNYYIVRAYSQSSLTYCCKLMKYFGEFERRLREFLYLVIIKTYGEKWFDETFDETLSDDIKSRIGKNSKQTIETALEELTYDQLTKYIFEPQIPKNLDAFFTEIKDESFFETPQEEIYNKIRSIRKLSLWEKLFSDRKDLCDLKVYIKELRPLRNSTMHHKNITRCDYLLSRKKLKYVNKILKNAVEEIENRNFTEFDFGYLTEMKAMMQTIIGDALSGLIEQLKDFKKIILEPIVETFKSFDFSQFLTGFGIDSVPEGDDTLLLEESNTDDEENDDNDEEKETEQ